VPYALQQLRLEPRSCLGQDVLAWRIDADGVTEQARFSDQHNNRVTLVSFESDHQDVHILCEGEIETTDRSGVVGEHTGCAPLWYFQRPTVLTRPGAKIRALAENMRGDHAEDIPLLHALSNRIAEAVAYKTGVTDAATTAEGAMEAGHGVCQDHAHIFISAARLLGFPARYVSGYLMMDDTDIQDASHAWAEAHVPDLGWVGIDVSNQVSPDNRYVRIATGLDYTEAAPISGITFGGHTEVMTVKLQVQQQ
jgi:transglutaminase-like putative cysteine protease